jgi:hypothetical protein
MPHHTKYEQTHQSHNQDLHPKKFDDGSQNILSGASVDLNITLQF